MAGNPVLPISFFKFILKTNVQSLKLPKKFTRIYGGGLANPLFLKLPDGTEWEVHWKKQNDEVWFEKGWKEFAENYSQDEGYIMVVFKYKGTSHFDVVILDQTSLEIDYPLDDTCEDSENLDQSDDDEPVVFLGERQDQKHKQKSQVLSPPPYKKDRGENAAQRSSLSMNWPKEARAQEVAKAFISSDNPFFTVTIKPTHLAKCRLYVPNLEGYVENIEKYAKLQIGERSWDVKLLRRYPNSGRRFSAGWSLFAKGSQLQPGDICIFELIKEDPVFEVHVTKSHS